MTRVLALDTSTWMGGLALVEGGDGEEPRTVAELIVDARDSHTDHLLRSRRVNRALGPTNASASVLTC